MVLASGEHTELVATDPIAVLAFSVLIGDAQSTPLRTHALLSKRKQDG